MIRVPRWKILATMFFCGVLGSVATWGLSARAVTDITAPDRYRQVEGLGPEKLIIRDQCMGAEDSASRLILVRWEPDRNRAVYRCVLP